MNARLKSLSVPLLLSGAWGVITFLLGYAFLNDVPYGYLIFYPALLTGVAAVSVVYSGSGIPLPRAALTGFLTGIIYLMLSSTFPLLAGILAGGSLGGGLSDSESRPGSFSGAVVSTLKGIIIFPLVIFSGKYLGALVLIFSRSVFLSWVFWGVWLGLGVCLIHTPFFGRRDKDCDAGFKPGLEEFRSQAREIEREIAELDAGMD